MNYITHPCCTYYVAESILLLFEERETFDILFITYAITFLSEKILTSFTPSAYK
jgi:hypothetical protein